MTKNHLLLVSILLLTLPSLFGQTPCVIGTGATTADLCDCINTNGELIGTIDVNANFTIPATITCSGTTYQPLFLGQVTFSIADGVTLVLGRNIRIADDALADFQGDGPGSRVRISGGGPIFSDGGAGPNIDGDFEDLEKAIVDCRGMTPICTLEEAVSAFLPVTLVSWTATLAPKGNRVSLEWTTASELDNDHYTLDHSTDGISYTELDRVPGNGTTDALLTYTLQHREPGPGTHYYRLSQTDFDGTHSELGVRSVTVGETDRLTLFPNPASEEINLNGLTAEAANVQLLDLNGRLIANYTLPGKTNRFTLTLPLHLAPGVYLVRSEGHTARLVLQRR